MIMSPPEVAAEAAQRRVVELEVCIAERAAFILVLKRNGSGSSRHGQARRAEGLAQVTSSCAQRDEMTNQAAANEKAAHGESGG
jgi:hypothetical protein